MRLPARLIWILVWLSASVGAQHSQPIVAQLNAPPGAAELLRIARPDNLGSGTLALAWHGEMLAAPELESHYAVAVGGVLARTRLRQTFENPTGEWLEAIYVFPLPDGAQVDVLELVVGQRRIVADVREREQARAEFERARAQGQRAGLLESERPNLFTTSITNIGPGERISVEIAWQQTVRYDAGRFELRLPLVVGPRYVPAEHGAAEPLDAARISAPVKLTGERANEVRVTVSLEAGMPLSDVRSLYHSVTQQFRGDSARQIELADPSVPADRDFVLQWYTAAAQPTTAVFAERVAGDDYALLQLFPPQGIVPARLPRDVVFVIDTSGSMDGTSIEQARQALLLALRQLEPADRFNVIRFASATQLLFTSPQSASGARLSSALAYVQALTSGGGTEMYHALNAALRQFEPTASARVQQIVFITDGNIGNEAALFELIGQLLGNARLYTVGIGSAPNGYFMRSAARHGRGTYTFIGHVDEVGERMSALFDKIAAPVLTDIEFEWPDGGAREVYPQRLPDLFAGEPLLVGIAGTLPASVTIRGRMAGAPWSQQLDATTAVPLAGVGRHWAQLRIGSLLETRHRNEPGDPTYDAVVATALAHDIVSRYTSLVAVDTAPGRAPGQPLQQTLVPLDLPAGWQAAGVGMRLPGTATSARLFLSLGTSLLGLALAGWLLRRRMSWSA